LSHPAMQKLGCEPVRQPRSRWPSRPATGSTSGTWNWMRRARSLQGTCALLSPQTKGRRTPVCTLSQDWRTFIVRDVLRTLLGGYLNQDSGRLRFCYGPHRNLASTWIQKESTSASHSLAISPFWPSRHPAPFRCCPPISKPDGYRRSATLWIRLRGMGPVLKGRVAVS
jgi:hypothetical protein